MKDDNGALKIGAVRTISREDRMDTDPTRAWEYAQEYLARLLGKEIIKSFPIEETPEIPPLDYAIQLRCEVVVMSKEDYEKLADDAWKYRDLSK